MLNWRGIENGVKLRCMRHHIHACLAVGQVRNRCRPPEIPSAELHQRGLELRDDTLLRFNQRLAHCRERVLLVTPPSPAGWVWFEDLRLALHHLGVAAVRIDDEKSLTPALMDQFRPTMLLALDTDRLHLRLDTMGNSAGSDCMRVLIPARDTAESQAPLTAAEALRLDRTTSGAGANVLMSLHAEPFMQRSVPQWMSAGKPFLWLPQAASPFRDEPHAIERQFDYAHLSVANPQRVRAVWHTMRGILARHGGLFGERDTWGFGVARMPVDEHARSQSMARVSLAPLVAPLLDVESDLTQRVYAAAASATFQITELSPLTRQHFDGDELIAVPRSDGAMEAAFERWLDDRQGRDRIAQRALERVHRDHTSLHRAERLIHAVQALR